MQPISCGHRIEFLEIAYSHRGIASTEARIEPRITFRVEFAESTKRAVKAEQTVGTQDPAR